MFRIDRLPQLYADLVRHGFRIGVLEQQRINELILTLHESDAFPETSDRLCGMLAAVLCSSREETLYFRQRFECIFGASHALTKPSARLKVFPALKAEPLLTDEAAARARGEQARLETRDLRFRIAAAMALMVGILILTPLLVRPLLSARSLVTVTVETPQVPAPQAQPPKSAQTSESEPVRPLLHGELWVGVSILLAMFAPFALLALWAASPSHRQTAFLSKRTLSKTPELIELLVSSPTRSPFDEPTVVSRLQGLRRPFYVQTQELDAEATLEESLRCGDFTPRYSRRAYAPEYLVLIERASAEDHSAALASSLVDALASAHVYVDVYYFSSDIRRLFSEPEASRISLEEVLGRHCNHRLMLLTNGNSLLDPVSGKLQNWARRFEEFPHRVLITPTPAGLWGYRELALSTAMRINILPLLPASVPTLVRLLAEPAHAITALQPESDRATGSLEGLADILEQRIGGWLSSTAPDKKTIEVLDRAMREAFTAEGMRWLAACAVYPELKWNLTLYIGATLRGETGAPTVNAGELLRLSLLPWFRDGRMPEWLRAQVLDTLTTQDYARVRAIYNRLLKSTFSASRKNAKLNFGVESGTVSDLDITEPTDRDQIVADFVSGLARKDRTSFRVAGEVTRRLLARMSQAHFRSRRVVDEIKETLADADALHTAMAQLDVQGATVTGVADEDLASMACFRQIVSLQDSAGNPVEMAENLILFVPTANQTAILLNEASAWRLQRRSRMSLRIATLNFVFVALAAVWYSDSILSEYPEGVAVFVVCLWLTLPYLAVEAILVRRLNQRFERFPKFRPVGNFAHKSHRFVMTEGAATRPDVETPA